MYVLNVFDDACLTSFSVQYCDTHPEDSAEVLMNSQSELSQGT